MESWVAQAAEKSGPGLPSWWPIAAFAIPLVVTLIVALIQMASSIRVAKIQAGLVSAKPAPEAIAQQVLSVLGEELDRRLGPEQMSAAQTAYERGRQDSEEAARRLLEAHQERIVELQAQLATRDSAEAESLPEPQAAKKLYNAGHDAQRAGQLSEAIGMYTAAILLAPTYAKAYYNRANAKYDLGDKRGAIEDYDQAILHDPGDAMACYNCANAKFDLGDLQGAIADYSECVRLDPTYPHAYYNRGNAKAALGKREEAMADYERVLAIDPSYSAAHYNLGCQEALLSRPSEAIAHLRRAIDLDPRWRVQAQGDHDLDSLHGVEAFETLMAG